MSVEGIGIDPSIYGQGANRFNQMTSEQFLKIMLAELNQQDPLEPQDSQAILDQISAIRDIEASMDLMDQIGSLVDQNKFLAAGNMVGKGIRGLDEMLHPAEGRVQSAGIEGDQIVLTLETGERVPFDQVEEIFQLSDDGLV